MSFRCLLLAFLATALPAAAQQTFTEVDGLLSVEAESFAARFPSTYAAYQFVHTWEYVADLPGPANTGSSGGAWMESLPDETGEDGIGPHVPEGTEGARMDYNIWINQPGTYYVWVRGKAKGAESNGVHVGLNGQLGGAQGISGFFAINVWTWESLRRNFAKATIQVDQPGAHTLNVWNRDDGFKCDKIVLARDIDYIPTGQGPPESLANQGTLLISPGSIPVATERVAFDLTFTTTQGVGPFSWSVEGSLPPGLTLDGPTGVLSGTPTRSGEFPFLVRVADSRGERGGRTYVMRVLAAPLQIISESPAPPAILGQPYSFQIEAIGGTPPYIYQQLRAYPPGLSINTSTGVVSGVPLQPGQFTFAVLLTDAAKTVSVEKVFALTVVGDPVSIVTSARLPRATVGEEYAAQLAAAGGAEPYVWSAVGALPEGFALSSSGLLTATPTDVLGEVSFRAAVTDALSSRVEREFSMVVMAPLASVTAAGFREGPLAPDSIVSAFGLELAEEQVAATQRPLPGELAGRRVQIVDSAGTRRPTLLFFVSPGQINYLLPPFIAPGLGTIEVLDPDNQVVASGPAEIQRVAPQLFVFTEGGIVAGYGVRVAGDGSQTIEELVRALPNGSLVPNPLAPLEESEQRYLVVFGTGLRAALRPPTATLAKTPVQVQFAGAHQEFDGLDQVNLGPLPTLSDDAAAPQLILQFDEGPTHPVTVPMAR